MLVQCYALFRKKPEILQGWQKRFQYILIDEFQDINRVQYEVIRMLAAPRYNLFVVGDDGAVPLTDLACEAKPELMLYMKQEFPSLSDHFADGELSLLPNLLPEQRQE